MAERAVAAPARRALNYCEEPFRIFFPIGALLALLGVSLWPLYYAGAVAEYPSILHARLLIEGFMASFIIGFLGTAGPRITSAPHFTRAEVLTLLTLDLLAAGLHCGGAHRAADFLFASCLAVFVFILGKRFAQRADSPPPNFALVALGLLNGIAAPSFLRCMKIAFTPFPTASAQVCSSRVLSFCRFSGLAPTSSPACSMSRARIRCRNQAFCREDGCRAPALR